MQSPSLLSVSVLPLYGRHTYEILAQTLHLHLREPAIVPRQSLQTRSRHSSQSSPRSKISPNVLGQRAHCRSSESCGRREPFRLISSRSFFNFLQSRQRREGDKQTEKRSKVFWALKSLPYPFLLTFPQLLVFLQHLQDHFPFMLQQKGQI